MFSHKTTHYMISGTPLQGFLTLQRPHENDSCSKSTIWCLAALLEPATLVPEKLQLGGGVYTLLNKRFVVAGRENHGDLGRNPTYEVSFFFVWTCEFHIPDFLFHHKRQKIDLSLPLWISLDFDIFITSQTPPAVPFWGEKS